MKNWKNMFKKKFFNTSFVILFLIVVMFLLITAGNKNIRNFEGDDNTISKLTVGAIENKEVVLSFEDVNRFLNRYVAESDKDVDLPIKNIYVSEDKKTGKTRLFVIFVYKKLKLRFSSYVTISLDPTKSKIRFELSKSKVGAVPISSVRVADVISKNFGNDVAADRSVLSFDSNIKINIYDEEIDLKIEKFEICDHNLIIKTNSIRDIIGDYLKGKLGISGDLCGIDWGSCLSNVKDIFFKN